MIDCIFCKYNKLKIDSFIELKSFINKKKESVYKFQIIFKNHSILHNSLLSMNN